MIAGRATAAGTAQFAAQQARSDFYRTGWDDLRLASIGLGTYLGNPDPATDERYQQAVRRYVVLGGNAIDSAVNYRFQRSERAIGAALQAAIEAGETQRSAVVVCTKGGYLSFDGAWPADPDEWVFKTFIEPGIVQPEDIVDGHCMAPAYLRHQIAQSRANLRLECIDLYYLHNPEGQRAALGETEFLARLREAFATFEVAVAQGHIGVYGTATWSGYRSQPGAADYLALETVLEVARDVAGDRHHFRAVQLPVNFQMLEALGRPNQPAAGGLTSFLQAAADHGLTVFASASLLQGRVLGRLPEDLRAKFAPGLTDAQRALQFVRSTPGLTVALVGMSRPEHVEENLALREVEPMGMADYQAVFR